MSSLVPRSYRLVILPPDCIRGCTSAGSIANLSATIAASMLTRAVFEHHCVNPPCEHNHSAFATMVNIISYYDIITKMR